ncbi:MAG: MCE family protein [Bryobacteraceae bacterium]|nr:MCE family protein [Bryobacteraceae bacterium]
MGDFKKSLVAVFVFGGLILFAVGLFLIGDRKKLFSGSVDIYTEWKDLGGLQNGAIVRVSGMTGGEVRGIELPPGPEQKFRVRIRVVEDFLAILRSDSVAMIQTDGVVGNKLVEISAGTAKGAPLEEGSLIDSREPFEFADLISEASAVLANVRQVVDDSKGQLQEVLDSASTIAQKTDDFITQVTPDLQKAVSSGSKVAEDVQILTARVRAGQGTVGRLLNDDALYNNARNISADIRSSTSGVRDMIEEAKQREIVKDVKNVTAGANDVVQRANDLLREIQPNQGEGSSLVRDLRQTLFFANEAMSDFSESAEALKHNWLLRGFFRRRGFFDLDMISVEDYQAGARAPGYPVKRVWVPYHALFAQQDDEEALTEEGKRRLTQAMAELLPAAKTNAVIVEGYASGANRTEQFVRSQERAHLVREYITRAFLLRPNYVGIMQMGEVQPESGGAPWEGVALVLFQPQPLAPETVNANNPQSSSNGR